MRVSLKFFCLFSVIVVGRSQLYGQYRQDSIGYQNQPQGIVQVPIQQNSFGNEAVKSRALFMDTLHKQLKKNSKRLAKLKNSIISTIKRRKVVQKKKKKKSRKVKLSKIGILNKVRSFVRKLKGIRLGTKEELVKNFNAFFEHNNQFYNKHFLSVFMTNFYIKRNTIDFKKTNKDIENRVLSLDLEKELGKGKKQDTDKVPVKKQEDKVENASVVVEADKKEEKARKLVNTSINDFYTEFSSQYSDLVDSKLEGEGIEESEIDSIINTLLAQFDHNEYYTAVFKLLTTNTGFLGLVNKDTHQLTGIDSFLDSIDKLPVKDDEILAFVSNYFDNLFQRLSNIQGKLVTRYPRLKEDLLFDHIAFYSDLVSKYNQAKFLKLNKIVDKFENQLGAIPQIDKEEYDAFVGECLKIYLAVFNQYLVLTDKTDFLELAEYYVLPKELFPQLQAIDQEGRMQGFTDGDDLLSTNDSFIADKEVDSLIDELGDQMDKINSGSSIDNNQLKLLSNKLENLIKLKYPDYYSQFKEKVINVGVDDTGNAHIKTSNEVVPVKVSVGKEDKMDHINSKIKADFHIRLPTNKKVKISMKTVKKGRMISRLFHEFFNQNTPDQNSELIRTIKKNLGKKIRQNISEKLDYLYDILDVYTKRFENKFHPEDLEGLKEFWRILVIFYSKNCYLRLYKKLIQRIEAYKEERGGNSFVAISRILQNFLTFLAKNNRYDFTEDCNKIVKLIVTKQRLTAIKVKRMQVFNTFSKILLKQNLKEELKEKKANMGLKGFSGINANLSSRKQKNHVIDLIKKAVLKKPGEAFRKDEESSESEHYDDEPSEDKPTSQSEQSESEEDDKPDNKERKYNFIKQLISTISTQNRYSNLDKGISFKKRYFGFKPKDFKYINILYKKYGNTDQILKSDLDRSHIFTHLSKLLYKRVGDHDDDGPDSQDDEGSNFSLFKKQLLHNFYLHELKDKLKHGKIKTSHKLVYKLNLNKAKNHYLKYLYNQYNDFNNLKDIGDQGMIFDKLKKILYKKKPFESRAHQLYKGDKDYSEMGTMFSHEMSGIRKSKKVKYKSVPSSEQSEEDNPSGSGESGQSSQKSTKESSEEKIKQINLPPAVKGPASNQSRSKSTSEEYEHDIDIFKVPSKCKIIKHCHQKCVRVDPEGNVTEIHEGDEGYVGSLCEQDEESGEEEFDCDKLDENDHPNEQINFSPVFQFDFDFTNDHDANAFREFIKDSSFVRKLEDDNTIDVKELKDKAMERSEAMRYSINVAKRPSKQDALNAEAELLDNLDNPEDVQVLQDDGSGERLISKQLNDQTDEYINDLLPTSMFNHRKIKEEQNHSPHKRRSKVKLLKMYPRYVVKGENYEEESFDSGDDEDRKLKLDKKKKLI